MLDQYSMPLGESRDEPFEIPYEVRMQNIAIYGSKGSGKTKHILPMLANEQLNRRDEGAVFVVEKEGLAWMLHVLAKKYNREVIFLSPSSHEGMSQLMSSGLSKIQEVTEHLVDFEKAMTEKKIIIIDAEPYKYQKRSVDLTGAILMNLQHVIYKNTSETPFFVYVEDGDLYLPYIKDLITYGEGFGVGTVLFLQGRAYMKARSEELMYFVESNFRTTILANGLIYEDLKYFNERFFGEVKDDVLMLQRRPDQLLVETLDGNSYRRVANVKVRFLSQQIVREVKEEAQQLKKKNFDIDVSPYSVVKMTFENAETKVKKPKNKPNNIKARKESKITPPAQSTRIFISEEDLFS